VESWSFLTNHARVLLCIARDPGVRLRDVAASLGITERSAHAIIADLTAAGYVVKQKHGRRNRYQIQAHLPLPEPASQEPAIGDVLALLVGDGTGQKSRGSAPGQQHAAINDDDHEQPPGMVEQHSPYEGGSSEHDIDR
jgi:MarR family